MNLVKYVVDHGGKLAPLVIDKGLTAGTGLMNPSVFVDSDGDILVNLRHVNYTLYHSENMQRFPSKWGPLAYLHPEKDMRLVTENYLMRLDNNLDVINHTKVTMTHDVAPLWEFVGLEDARLVQWDNDYYLIGVRRDTTTNGEGRMEYTKIAIDKKNWEVHEQWRTRIPTPGANDSYCEKNWVPVIDKPYHFIKWTIPTELVHSTPFNPSTTVQVLLKEPPFPPPADQRGSSHVFTWGDFYVSITHEVNLFKNYLQQKDGRYRHRFVVWDKDFNMVGLSNSFTFLEGHIEFCVGAAVYEGDLLISFGFQDNAAFILRTPGELINNIVNSAITEGIEGNLWK